MNFLVLSTFSRRSSLVLYYKKLKLEKRFITQNVGSYHKMALLCLVKMSKFFLNHFSV